MTKNLLSRINEMKPGFSKGQRLIAGFITEHYDKAAFMTAAKLGSTVGISESTVVRFATELGYDGYPKMQKAMQEMIRDRLTSVQRIEVTQSRISGGNVLETVLSKDIEKIRSTLEETSKEDFENAVDAIAHAKTIYIFAVRSAAALASFLGYYYSLIFENVKVISNYGETEIYEKLFRISTDDVIIGISFPRYSNAAIQAMTFAKRRGTKVIALTDSMASPLAAVSDYLLIAKSDMAAVVDSLVAPLSMINALIVATVLKMGDDVKHTFGMLENIWQEYDVYQNNRKDETE
ncbi:MAG: MurR/RpiR family transcriptional regulator [Acutalibacteraceae bacterium]|nr:MurR/RpiR family transcriptional regulator [Clostridia bacterium]MEE3403633.1 MurR/RpiR family transcriptional regulator [Acutalibacteraceae bacterium]